MNTAPRSSRPPEGAAAAATAQTTGRLRRRTTDGHPRDVEGSVRAPLCRPRRCVSAHPYALRGCSLSSGYRSKRAVPVERVGAELARIPPFRGPSMGRPKSRMNAASRPRACATFKKARRADLESEAKVWKKRPVRSSRCVLLGPHATTPPFAPRARALF